MAAASRRNLELGKIVGTQNPSDLAIQGDGFFAIKSGDDVALTRNGRLQRSADGRLVTTRGYALQADGGGEVVIGSGAFEVTSDGVVVQEGRPLARLAVVSFKDLSLVSEAGGGDLATSAENLEAVERPQIRQGAYEASNVSTGDEMVAIMEALRRAEAGQRLINVYDDLMGRALSTLAPN